jgi:hypothetical protein
MISLDKYLDLSLDPKVESFIAELMAQDEGLDDVVIEHIGPFRRAFRKDVESIIDADLTDKGFSGQIVEVNRNSLYDVLPESLFHQTPGSNRIPSEMKANVEANKRDARSARRFFAPLDHQFSAAKCEVSYLEKSSITSLGDVDMANPLSDLWPLPKWFVDEKRALFVILAPLFYQIMKKNVWIEKTFATFIDMQVNIEYRYANSGLSDVQSDSGSVILGINSVLGQQWTDFNTEIRVKIGPVPKDRVKDITQEGKVNKTVTYLADYLFPADTDVSVSYSLAEPGWEINEKIGESTLGLSTVI